MWRMVLIALLTTTTALADPITPADITVVDGDTIDARGDRYRLWGYDTPEVSTGNRAVGPKERALAEKATARFRELLRSGPLELKEVRCSCPEKTIGTKWCNRGRKCATLNLNGSNIGNVLIAEGLAVKWECVLKTKCPRLPDWPTIVGER